MIIWGRSYQRDVYRCINCTEWVAGGDRYCKHCGRQFDDANVALMIENSTFLGRWKAPFHSPLDELLKCTRCEEFLAYSYEYCKRCGKEITQNDRAIMIGDDQPGKIGATWVGLMFFVAILVFFTLLISIIL